MGGGEDALAAALTAAGSAGSSAVGGHVPSGYSFSGGAPAPTVVPGVGVVPNYYSPSADGTEQSRAGKRGVKGKADKRDTDGLKAAFIPNERRGAGL